MPADPPVDYLIIGSGIAGLRAAVGLAGRGRTLLLTKSSPDAGSTGYAQGGIAAAVGSDDSADRHGRDTIAAGDGLCDEAAVRVLVADGPAAVRDLIDWGAQFDHDPDGAIDLAREAAHSVRRVLHARDATGREIARVLAARLTRVGAVEVRDHATVVQLTTDGSGVTGACYLDARGALHRIEARATLLATGGAGQVYRETTNPVVATGDGIALAWLAGATVVDLEFVQFHPTALAVRGMPRFLLSEALRGDGARLINLAGEPFMARYHPSGDLAPRDHVARALVREAARTGAPVCLSLAHLPAETMRARYPHIAALCASAGLDLARDPLPVSPAAHYLMGGVLTDTDGRTTLPGLYAAGEVACTGVHGANRLASNSLLEGLVFGRRAAEAMLGGGSPIDAGVASSAGSALRDVAERSDATRPPGAGAARGDAIAAADVPDLMWRHVGVFRTAEGLVDAVGRLDHAWARLEPALDLAPAATDGAWRRAAITIVGRLIARAALARHESRGAHARADFPERDDLHWKRRLPHVRGR